MLNFQAILVTFLVAVLTVSGVLILSGLRRHRFRATHGSQRDGLQTGVAPFDRSSRTALPAGQADLDAVLATVLARNAGRAAYLSVDIVTAIPPDLVAATDPEVLRESVSAVLSEAIEAASGGSVLLSAVRRGNRIDVVVTDDAADGDAAVREAALRDQARTVALLGGSLTVERCANNSLSVTLRVAAAPRSVSPRAADSQAAWEPTYHTSGSTASC